MPSSRRTEATLIAHGFPAHLTEINGHGHNYYDRSNQINEAVWTFLQKQQLTSDPIYQQHRFARSQERFLPRRHP